MTRTPAAETATDLDAQAAAALVRALPTEAALTVGGRVSTADGAAAESFEASWIGAVSVDVAIGFATPGSLDAGDGLDVRNLLHPALAAASGVYGTGVLGDVRAGGALLEAPDAVVFELLDGDRVAGWFAVRPRGAAGSAGATGSGGVAGEARLGRINGVEMALTVEIGRTRMTVRDILNLEPGAVVELDRSAGAPADILLNGRVIAHGEVVVVDQDYAVRVTRILDAQDGAA